MARDIFSKSGLVFLLGFTVVYLGCRPASNPEPSKPSSRETTTSTTSPSASPSESSLPKTQPAGEKATGTPGKSEIKPSVPQNTAGEKEKPVDKENKKAASKPLKPATPPRSLPKVGLTDALRATCLVQVGDVMPQGELLAGNGKTNLLKNLFGEKLTVLFFWSNGESDYVRKTAESALHDLQADLVEPYENQGVKVLAVNVAGQPDAVKKQIEKSGVKAPCYFDPKGTLFAKIATGHLPRLYLLDASGKILWFDVEYSRVSRRNLIQAVQFSLSEK
jgi:peroxiredoxin